MLVGMGGLWSKLWRWVKRKIARVTQWWPEYELSQDEFQALHEAHVQWLDSDGKLGKRLCLFGADLRQVELSPYFPRLNKAVLQRCWFPQKSQQLNLAGAQVQKSVFRLVFLYNIDAPSCDATKANFSSARINGSLGSAKFSHATFYGASLRADLNGATFVGAKGLFEGIFRKQKADLAGNDNAEHAIYARQGDLVNWTVLQWIGSIPIFAVSNVALVGIIVYAKMAEWFNARVDVVRDTSQPNEVLQSWLIHLGHVPIRPDLRYLLIAIFALAFGSGLYKIFCPKIIKEYSQTKWERELPPNFEVLEYRAAMYSAWLARYLSVVFYVLGGAYTIYYIIHRSYDALRVLFELAPGT